MSPAHGDPFSTDGIYRISENGDLLAYEVKHGGEDRKEIRIIDMKSGTVLADTVPHGYARGFAFAPRGDGYFYVQEEPLPVSTSTRFAFTGSARRAARRLSFERRSRGSRLI